MDTSDFDPKLIAGIPDDFVMSDEELAKRKDFRKTRFVYFKKPVVAPRILIPILEYLRLILPPPVTWMMHYT